MSNIGIKRLQYKVFKNISPTKIWLRASNTKGSVVKNCIIGGGNTESKMFTHNRHKTVMTKFPNGKIVISDIYNIAKKEYIHYLTIYKQGITQPIKKIVRHIKPKPSFFSRVLNLFKK